MAAPNVVDAAASAAFAARLAAYAAANGVVYAMMPRDGRPWQQYCTAEEVQGPEADVIDALARRTLALMRRLQMDSITPPTVRRSRNLQGAPYLVVDMDTLPAPQPTAQLGP